VRQIFISYARANRQVIRQLDADIREFGCGTWVDSVLSGGQDWWDEILRQIAACDAFVAAISRDSLNSEACEREFNWAVALRKPVLPVAVERMSAVPKRIAKLHMIDYSDPDNRSKVAGKLAGGLINLPPPPPLPRPLPEPPAPPLSYLSDLIELAMQKGALGHDQQHAILQQLEPALLRTNDPDERQGGREILEIFANRHDLYADVYRRLNSLIDDSRRADRTQAVPAPAKPTITPQRDDRPQLGVPIRAPLEPRPFRSSETDRQGGPPPPRPQPRPNRPTSNSNPHLTATRRGPSPAGKTRQNWFVALVAIAAALAIFLIAVVATLMHEQSSGTSEPTIATVTELPQTP
jgi:hypothetical protein